MKHQQAQPQAPQESRLPAGSRTGAPVPRSPSELLVPTRPPSPPKRLKAEREPRRMNGFFRFIDGTLSFVFVGLMLIASVSVWLRHDLDAPGPLHEAAAVVIPKGEGAIEIAERLEKASVIADRRVFMMQYYATRFFGGGGAAAAQSTASSKADAASLKAGEYQFPQAVSVRQVLDIITSGRGVLQKITIPEGLTSRQIVARLKAEPGLSGDIVDVPPEGVLLPDTYKFSRGTSRQEILDRMRAEHGKLVASLWAARDQGLPLQTPEEALTLASIVEKETGRADERPRVAAVFVNRLRKGMRLQSDPTIVYGLVGGQGPLGRGITRSDIDSRTPYNTYQIEGLPPGPICNPGKASLAATLNPPATQDLFFVADGTGGHTFTATLKDHNVAVQNWRRIERSRQPADAAGVPAPQPAPSTTEAAAEVAPVKQQAPKAGKAPTVLNASKAAAGEGAAPVPRKKPKEVKAAPSAPASAGPQAEKQAQPKSATR